MLTKAWLQGPEEGPVTTLPPRRDTENPPHEGTEALQSTVRKQEVGFTEENLEQVLKWGLVFSGGGTGLTKGLEGGGDLRQLGGGSVSLGPGYAGEGLGT